MAKTKAKTYKKKPKCLSCDEGTKVPDTIQFRPRNSDARMFLACGYCERPLAWGPLSRLNKLKIRSKEMAERANGVRNDEDLLEK